VDRFTSDQDQNELVVHSTRVIKYIS